jgi:hypothetical protein
MQQSFLLESPDVDLPGKGLKYIFAEKSGFTNVVALVAPDLLEAVN